MLHTGKNGHFMKRSILSLGLIYIFILFFLSAKTSYAATLASVSDTITTSRPSASAPLQTGNAANDTQVKILDNGSIFLASDSATFRPDTGETINTGVNVSSMSAQISGTPNTRIVYFTNSNGVVNTHHTGDPVVVPITAMHTISFRTVAAIPTSGKITITFPALTTGDANIAASPSATTFQLNALSDTNVKINGLSGAATFTGTYTNPSNGTSPTIALALTGTTTIAASTTVTILLGCSANSGASCTTQVPTIINPTKTQTAGTADSWALTITTTDVTNSIDLDTAKIRIGTVESVQVQATVDPTLTFTIASVADAGNVKAGNTTGCTTTDTTNTGIASTATTVNLGNLSSGAINLSAQLITISTNAQNGYSLTATSSGHLINPATGFWIADSTTPTVMTAGTPWFGFRPCGLNIVTSSPAWAASSTNTGGGTGAKYAWPTQTSSLALASKSTGPIGNSITAGDGLVTIEYASTVDVTVPAGIYSSVITYVATPTF